MSNATNSDWRGFETRAAPYFSDLWGAELRQRSVLVGDLVPWAFDLVSKDGRFVGDAKWLKNIGAPSANWKAISEYVWLLQKVRAEKVFLVFGQDTEVAERYLARVRPLTAPVEFWFLDDSGHRRLEVPSRSYDRSPEPAGRCAPVPCEPRRL